MAESSGVGGDPTENGPGLDLLEVVGLEKSFVHADGSRLPILSDLDFHLGTGETVAIEGASGIGKSTFLHIIGTLDRPDGGRIRFRGEEISGLPPDRLAEFRNRRIGFVFQFHHLLPEFTALENAMMPLLVGGSSRKEAAIAARALLERVGMGHRLGHRVNTLSGGEQQRVAVARALVNRPPLLLADEPTGNLDKKNGERLHELLMDLNREMGMALVVVTHSAELAALMSRRMTLREGRLVSA